MFLDTTEPGGPGGEPWVPACKSCRAPIHSGQPVERIVFDPNDSNGLGDMTGTYHAACAAPILSVKRAYDMLSGNWF